MILKFKSTQFKECIDITPQVRKYVQASGVQEGLCHVMALHATAAILGPSETIPIQSGDLLLGTWQALMLVELDGPRPSRQVKVTLI